MRVAKTRVYFGLPRKSRFFSRQHSTNTTIYSVLRSGDAGEGFDDGEANSGADLFNGFVYTYGGGALKDIDSPTTTETGYVNGPNGKAVIYADGHVKWRRN